MKKYHITSIIALFVVLSMIFMSCGPKKSQDKLIENAPAWVQKGSGAFKEDDGKAKIYGVGISATNPNIALQRTMSENRARQELAAVINTHVQRLITDFMESHQDYKDPTTAGSIEFASVISRNVTDATLVGSQIMDRWMDEKGNLYTLASLSYDDVVASIKEKTAEAIKKQGVFIKEKATEALSKLDEAIENSK